MRTITIEFPDEVYASLEHEALEQKTSVEALLLKTVRGIYEEWETGDITEEERRLHAQMALDREDLWGSEEDKCWDTWTPSNPETSSS
jgi:hypothetical protein